MTFSAVVKVKDKLSSGIFKARQKLKSAFKTIVVPVTVAVASTALALGGALSAGMELEQQQVSMEHFIGATNKGWSQSEVKKVAETFSNELRENANATPFETGEVLSAGSRAVAIANGNTKDAMSMVKLAEDMAAASGGTKTLSDAIEALADAKMGETERLKEFGFKISADEFNAKGYEGVSSDLNDFFGGAAEKLSTTGAGLLSTIKGKLKSNFADFGLSVLEQLKPTFEGVIGIIDKTSPMFEEFGLKVVDGIAIGINGVKNFLPKVKTSIDALKPTFELLRISISPIFVAIGEMFTKLAPMVLPSLSNLLITITDLISKASPIVVGLVEIISSNIEAMAPVFSSIASSISEKVGRVIDIVASKMDFIKEVFATVAPVIMDIFETSWNVISPIIDMSITAFELLFKVVETVFPKIQSIIGSVWDFIKPVVEGIGTVFEKASENFSKFASYFGVNVSFSSNESSGEKVGKNARGTNNWRGGLTWVGEEGPELIDLPKGSRVLPNKESISFSQNQLKENTLLNSTSIIKEQKTKIGALAGGTNNWRGGLTWVGEEGAELIDLPKGSRMLPNKESVSFSKKQLSEEKATKAIEFTTNNNKEVVLNGKEDNFQVPEQNKVDKITEKVENIFKLTIAKLADTIVVREEADIDKIGEKVAKEIKKARLNMV